MCGSMECLKFTKFAKREKGFDLSFEKIGGN